jgi:branched-chain amino acid transport system substrate-binding protein
VLADNVIGPDATITKVAVVFDDDPYGIGLSQAFTTRYPMMAPLIPYDVAGDVSGVAPAVAAENVDAVLVISLISSDTVAILKNLASAGLAGKKYFFSDGAKDKTALLDPSLPADVQMMIKGAKGTTPARPSGQNYDLFKVTYEKEFGIEADQYAFVAQTYDAGYAAAYGVVYAEGKSPDYDGRLVAEGLAHLSAGVTVRVGPVDWTPAKSGLSMDPFQINLVGASGELDFNAETGEAPAPIEVWGVNVDFTDFTTEGLYTPSN